MVDRPTTDGISDAAVHRATGRGWTEWFELLDEAGAVSRSHPEIVAAVRRHGGVSSWWEQMIAVAYERARGLRRKHEKPDGFQISVSRTFDTDPGSLFSMWEAPSSRRPWLQAAVADAGSGWSTSRRPSQLRGPWGPPGSRLDVSFAEVAPGRTRVTVRHHKLPDAEQAEIWKRRWRAALASLGERC